MKLPTEIEIKGKRWQIKRKWNLKDDDGERVDGLCITSERLILIDHTCPKADLKRVLLHEINHAILFELHIFLHYDSEQTICDGLASVYLDLFALKLKA